MARGAVLLAAMLVAAFTTSVAIADDTATTTPRDDVASVLAGLGGDDHSMKAAEKLGKALEDENWLADGTPSKKGDKVFKEMGKAAKELEKAGDVASAQALLAIAEAMTDGALAVASPENAEKAAKDLAKALEEEADGDLHKAIEKYGKAWKDATKGTFSTDAGSADPVTAATGAFGGYAGDYAAYTVVYQNQLTGEFITVTGLNAEGTPGYTGKGNEGYIFSEHFSAIDSAHGTALSWNGMQGMQLHVSCSDAFIGGTGDKSDPAETAEWYVNTITIEKYKDGQFDKGCELDGLGLDVPPQDPPADDPPADDPPADDPPADDPPDPWDLISE